MTKYVFKPYSALFPALFSKEKERIEQHVQAPLQIEHIGSTAVPGLGGKGIIDIAIATEKNKMDLVSTQLQKLGYEFRPSFSTHDRFYFITYIPDKEDAKRRYHIHLTYPTSQEWEELIGFRDHLRYNPQATHEYALLKQEAASQANNNGEIYRKLKEPAFTSWRPPVPKNIALVTGASSGIGKALVHELLLQGYEVIGIARSQEKLTALQAEIQSPLLSLYQCDVSNYNAVKQLSNTLKQARKIPSLFFLNAGIAGQAAVEPIDDLQIETHHKIFSVNYYGVLHFVTEWLDRCAHHGGATFVASNSLNAFFAPPTGSAYAASKAAIAKTFDGLRLAYAARNLHFLSVFCGPVDTPGLVGKLPFTWSAEKMASYMIDQAQKEKNHSYPSFFYTFLSKILNKLPLTMVTKIFKKENPPKV